LSLSFPRRREPRLWRFESGELKKVRMDVSFKKLNCYRMGDFFIEWTKIVNFFSKKDKNQELE
jgi:hypothetical protein